MAARRLLLAAALALLPSSAPFAAPQPAWPADSVADMVGVNTHISYPGTAYDTGYARIIKPRLLELGVRHIRDNPGQPLEQWVRDRYIDLARSGVRLLLINYPDRGLGYAKQLIAQGGGTSVVEAVEPMNERDIPQRWFNCTPNWQACIRGYILETRQDFKADPVTAALPFIGPSFANTRDSALSLAGTWSGAGAFMDRGNLHDYSGLWPESPQGAGWGISVGDAIDRFETLSGTDAMWVTENGFKLSGAVSGHPSVTPRAAAKYLPRSLLYHHKLGVRRFYIYQLINDNEEDFGLLNDDGSPRPQFTAVKNLIDLFANPGPSFTPAGLDYAVSGNLGGVHRLLFQKRDGTYLLALWQGVNSASGTSDDSRGDVEPRSRGVTLTLPRPFSLARVFYPSFRATPARTARDVTSLGLAVTDHLAVVELTP